VLNGTCTGTSTTGSYRSSSGIHLSQGTGRKADYLRNFFCSRDIKFFFWDFNEDLIFLFFLKQWELVYHSVHDKKHEGLDCSTMEKLNFCKYKAIFLRTFVFCALVTGNVLYALVSTTEAKSETNGSNNNISPIMKVTDVVVRDDDATAIVSTSTDHTMIRGSTVKSTQTSSTDVFSVPFFEKSDSLDNHRDLQSCRECRRTYLYFEASCPDGYERDYTYDEYEYSTGGYYGWGSYTYEDDVTCYDDRCCSNDDATGGCCKPSCETCSLTYLWDSCPAGYEINTGANWGSYLTTTGCQSNVCCSDYSATGACCNEIVAPVAQPVPVYVPVPIKLPISPPMSLPVSPPTSNRTNPNIYVAVGILVPLVIALVVAVICIMNRKKATETKKKINSNNLDHTTVEQTRSAESPSQATPVKIVSVTPPPVRDAPTSIPMMQADDVSMMTEDYFSVWNRDTRNIDLQHKQDDIGMTYVPIVTGSIVGGSVATTDYYKKSSKSDRDKKDIVSDRPDSSNKTYRVEDDDDDDDDDVTEF
jgi:hypothetical protein